jgi:hypothetical protein
MDPAPQTVQPTSRLLGYQSSLEEPDSTSVVYSLPPLLSLVELPTWTPRSKSTQMLSPFFSVYFVLMTTPV